MNKRLETIVNLNEYPINNLESPKIKKLIHNCKKELEEFVLEFVPVAV